MKITGDALARVACDEAFSSLSVGAQALYFRLVLAADDAGFVLMPSCLERFIGAPKGSLAELDAGGYIKLLGQSGCDILKGKPAPVQDKRERKREQTRERVRRYRERQKKGRACNADVTPCNADVTPGNAQVTPCNTPSPSSRPPSSPSLPSPTPLSITPPIAPHITPLHPEISSSSLLYGERVREIALRFWDRGLSRYEQEEIFELMRNIVRLRGVGAEMCDDDVELLEIAFEASAVAGARSLAYLRGVYLNWKRGDILNTDAYWENEVRRDRPFSRGRF